MSGPSLKQLQSPGMRTLPISSDISASVAVSAAAVATDAAENIRVSFHAFPLWKIRVPQAPDFLCKDGGGVRFC